MSIDIVRHYAFLVILIEIEVLVFQARKVLVFLISIVNFNLGNVNILFVHFFGFLRRGFPQISQISSGVNRRPFGFFLVGISL